MNPSDPAASAPILALDPDFGKLAVAMGTETWSLPEFDLRMAGFLCIAGDLCHGLPELAFEAHVGVSLMNGVSRTALREVLIHLAPQVGYVMSLQALKHLARMRAEQEKMGPLPSETLPDGEPFVFPPEVADRLRAIDPWMLASLERQVSAIWSRPGLAHADRALLNVAVDVLSGSLGVSLECDVLLAKSCGVTDEQLLALPRFAMEYSAPRALDAAALLRKILTSSSRIL